MPQLVVRSPNHVGDCVMSLSAVGALRDLFQESQIHILAPEHLAGLYKYHPSVDDVIQLRGSSHGWRSVTTSKQELRDAGVKFEIGILFTESLSSAAAMKLAGVTNIYGYPGNGRNFMLTASPDPRGIVHRSTRYQRLARFAALTFWANPYWVDEVAFERPEIYFREVERKAAQTLLEKHNLTGERGFVAIAPRAVAESRRWGTENYAELTARIVRESGFSVCLVGSEDDSPAAERVRELSGVAENVANLCGHTRLRGAAAILERACCFVGNDSGLAHLAALVDIPLVVLSGADNPADTSPLSERKRVLIKDELDCISCVRNVCPKSGAENMQCMKRISVDEVFNALREALS